VTGSAPRNEGAVRPRRPRGRPFRATLFLAAALCFFLPFGTVSCGDPVQVTGIELVTRSVPGAGIEHGEANFEQEVEDQGCVPAALAFGAALAGLALALWGARRGWTLGLSLFGLAALGVLRFFASGADKVQVEVGFIGALVCFGLATLEHLNAVIVDREKSSTTRVPPGALPRL
jgi:hypothetical protein